MIEWFIDEHDWLSVCLIDMMIRDWLIDGYDWYDCLFDRYEWWWSIDMIDGWLLNMIVCLTDDLYDCLTDWYDWLMDMTVSLIGMIDDDD